jgi:hypothetical protein
MNRYDSITHSFARAPWLVEGAARSLELCSNQTSEPMLRGLASVGRFIEGTSGTKGPR